MGPPGASADVLTTGSWEISSSLKLPSGARVDHAVLRRVGDTVELAITGLRSRDRIDAVLGKIPEGFRPSHAVSLVTADDGFRPVRIGVEAKTSARLSVSQAKGAEGLSHVSTTIVWLTDDKWPTRLPGKEWRR
jgi:hypothetical protein